MADKKTGKGNKQGKTLGIGFLDDNASIDFNTPRRIFKKPIKKKGR